MLWGIDVPYAESAQRKEFLRCSEKVVNVLESLAALCWLKLFPQKHGAAFDWLI